VVVTITHANAGALGRITETLPAGFTYVSSNVAAENVTVTGQMVTGQMVRFTLLEVESPFTYTVTASSTVGAHSFSGVVRDSDKMENAVGGASEVKVGASADRSFSTTVVSPAGRVVVTITHANAGALGRITETLPAGFTYVSSNVAAENVTVTGQMVTGQMVRFTLLEVESPFTYTVTASSTVGAHSFSGVVRDSDKMENAVGGASEVKVGASADRSFSTTGVSPGGRVVVTITHANAGALGRITETLPAGFSYVSSSVDPHTFPAMSPPKMSRSPARWSPARWSASPCWKWNLLSHTPLPRPAQSVRTLSPVWCEILTKWRMLSAALQR
jgi:hypothetical protein